MMEGESVQYVELMQARQNDLLLLRNGEKIPPDILLNPVEFINQWNEKCGVTISSDPAFPGFTPSNQNCTVSYLQSAYPER